jgi:hypothetical protein
MTMTPDQMMVLLLLPPERVGRDLADGGTSRSPWRLRRPRRPAPTPAPAGRMTGDLGTAGAEC